MPINIHKLRVFLCHASQDKPVVRGLFQRLVRESWIEPWLDEEKLLPGQDWDLEIKKVVEKTDVVIVCFSKNSVNKDGYIQKEMRMVLEIADRKPEGLIFIIPMYLEECEPPYRFRNWQYLKYFPKRRRSVAYNLLRNSLLVRAKTLGIKTGDVFTPLLLKPKKAQLIWRHGEHKGRVIPINQLLTIGRLDTNNLQISDRTVSRKHAKIVQRKSRYYVFDLDSSSGTCLNGQKIQPNTHLLLNNGDIIRIGYSQEFELRLI